MFDIFLVFAQNIDCGYTLEMPRRGGSNEYPQSMFWSICCYVKVGRKGVYITHTCYPDHLMGNLPQGGLPRNMVVGHPDMTSSVYCGCRKLTYTKMKEKQQQQQQKKPH